MNKRKNIDWAKMAKYLDQEMNSGEREDFEKTIQSDQEYGQILSSARKIWNKTKTKQNMIEVNTDSAWEKLKTRIESQKTPAVHSALRIAAVLLITVGLSLIIIRSFLNPLEFSNRQITLRSEPDRMMETTLADGSVVHIKANSVISYEPKGTGSRELALKGEAFFDITPDQDRPFIVSTKQALIKVFGTSFSVQADEESHTVNVYVESGLVSLTNKLKEDQSLVIEPGYIGILNDKGIEKKIYENENYLAWKTGKLEFREIGLGTVIDDLNHTYGTNIAVDNPEIGKCNFTGTFLDHQPVDTVLEVLKTAFNLDIKRTRSEIILSGKGCN